MRVTALALLMSCGGIELPTGTAPSAQDLRWDRCMAMACADKSRTCQEDMFRRCYNGDVRSGETDAGARD